MRISDWSSDVCSSDLLCFQTKCPYIPPHEWNIDFPHLMLRAKAVKFRRDSAIASAKLLSNTKAVGKLASIPLLVKAVNWGNRNSELRGVLESTIGGNRDAAVPAYHRAHATTRVSTADSSDNAGAPGT